MKKIFKNLKSGFTIIELLTVVTIIGILVTLITVNYSNSYAKARDARRKQDLATYSSAIESYFDDYSYYPRAKGAFGALAILVGTDWNGQNSGKVAYLHSYLDDPLVKDPKSITNVIDSNDDDKEELNKLQKSIRLPNYPDCLGIKGCLVFFRYAYYGGGAEPDWANYKPTIFEYLISAGIENAASKLGISDNGQNPYRYEIGHGINKDGFYTCGDQGTYSTPHLWTDTRYDCRNVTYVPPN